MKKFKEKGFTLIELIAVLVIMAILALIATPLVMNIIRKARVSADKRSIDAYGRSIELAIAGYLLDNGKFPTDISQLTIEYSGDEVVCETTQINTDSSVYLAGCKVKGRDVTNYTYGSDKYPSYKAYKVGDEVTYNNVDYYVIKDSGAKESKVTLLKAEPLSAEEITTYSAGTGAQTDGNGGMQYGTSNDYSNSYIKITVDAWKNANAPESIDARLISKEEIDNNFEFEEYDIPCGGGCIYKSERISETWMYNSDYSYWTMSSKSDTSDFIWFMTKSGFFDSNSVNNTSYFSNVVRPVIVLDKSVLPTD